MLKSTLKVEMEGKVILRLRSRHTLRPVRNYNPHHDVS